MWLLATLACDPPGEPAVLALSRDASRVSSITLPEGSRDGPVPTVVELGPWTASPAKDGLVEWTAPLPIEHVDYGHTSRRQPSGMALEGPRKLRYRRLSDDDALVPYTWDLRSGVRIRLPETDPEPAGLSLTYERATAKDRRLHRASAGLDDWDFVTRPINPARESLRGLYLPAPAAITFRVLVPEEARFGFDAELMKPVFRDGESDGAAVVVSVDGVEQQRFELAAGKSLRTGVDLSGFGGQTVDLTVATDPGATWLYDHVFLGDPVLFTPSDEPRTVLLVFVDTLRADALGVYGGDPETSPVLDAWAQDAVVFETARSPAPWTVPSTRTALSGRQPDLWDPEQSLPAVLAREGFRTEAFISNAFLDTPFGQGESWGRYHYEYLANATKQVDRAIDALQRRTNRDRLVMVHFMEPHVPYLEPEPYASMWVGEVPKELERGMGRDEVDGLGSTKKRLVMPYLEGRYRQNIRYLDTELARLFEAAPDDAVIVLFSDHGEEFGEHGSFEHGHALYEELLHVPLVIQAPGLEPTRVTEPVGLIDLMPTVLELLGMPHETDGISLVAAAKGDAAARAELTERPTGVGFTLYETDAWGLIDGSTKWILRDGLERLYDLAEDPGESNGRRPTREESQAMTPRLSQALGREVGPAWRVVGYGKNKHTPSRGMELRLEHPDGVAAAWGAYDPLGNLATPELVDGAAVVVQGDGVMPREWYVVPSGAIEQVEGLTISRPNVELSSTYEGEPVPIEGRAKTILSMGSGLSRVSVMPVRTPAPVRGATTTLVPEREAELRALGYLD